VLRRNSASPLTGLCASLRSGQPLQTIRTRPCAPLRCLHDDQSACSVGMRRCACLLPSAGAGAEGDDRLRRKRRQLAHHAGRGFGFAYGATSAYVRAYPSVRSGRAAQRTDLQHSEYGQCVLRYATLRYQCKAAHTHKSNTERCLFVWAACFARQNIDSAPCNQCSEPGTQRRACSQPVCLLSV
jgi:hypothetical protein